MANKQPGLAFRGLMGTATSPGGRTEEQSSAVARLSFRNLAVRCAKRTVPIPLIEPGATLDNLFERGTESAFGFVSDCAGYLCETKLSLLEEITCKDKARSLAALGGEPLLGSLSDIDILETGADKADGVIHTAFGVGLGQPAVFAQSAKVDRRAIETFGEIFQRSDRPILVTGGIGVLPRGQGFTEETPPPPVHPAFPRESEQTP